MHATNLIDLINCRFIVFSPLDPHILNFKSKLVFMSIHGALFWSHKAWRNDEIAQLSLANHVLAALHDETRQYNKEHPPCSPSNIKASPQAKGNEKIKGVCFTTL